MNAASSSGVSAVQLVLIRDTPKGPEFRLLDVRGFSAEDQARCAFEQGVADIAIAMRTGFTPTALREWVEGGNAVATHPDALCLYRIDPAEVQ